MVFAHLPGGLETQGQRCAETHFLGSGRANRITGSRQKRVAQTWIFR